MAQLVLHGTLHPRIDGKHGGGATGGRVGEPLIEHLLHAHVPMAVRSNITQHMRRHRSLRIKALSLSREFQCWLAKGVDAVGILGQNAAAQIARLARGQPFGQPIHILVGENLHQSLRHLARGTHQRRAITQRVRIEPQGIGRELARQGQALPVDDITARWPIGQQASRTIAFEQAQPGNLKHRHQRNRAKQHQHLSSPILGHNQGLPAQIDQLYPAGGDNRVEAGATQAKIAAFGANRANAGGGAHRPVEV